MIAGHKGEIPFFVLIVPFLSGIILGLYVNSSSLVYFLLTVLLITISVFILLNVFYKSFRLYKQRWLGGVLIHLVLLLTGWLITINYNELNHAGHFSKKPAEYLVVKINNEPKASNGFLRFTADAEKSVFRQKTSAVSGTLLITIRDSAANSLYYGDELMIPANYTPVESPANPAEFNYKKYLANQKIHYQAFLQQGQFVVLRRNAGNPIIAYSLRLRQHLVDKLKAHMHSPEAIGVASTLILGYKADLSNDVLQAYSKTGTIHVLSVSGAHVAIIFYLINMALFFMDRSRRGQVIKAILVILLIWAYSLLTGFSPAVCRAAFMISMIIIGKTYNRHINTLNILAISAFFLLLYDPLFIVDVGFQLSYLAVAGMVIFQPIIYKWFDFENRWADKLWILCSASIAAQVITFPLSAYYFHQFPVYFLISNLFIIIPSMVILYAGMGYLFLPGIPIISVGLAWILEKSILVMDDVLATIEHTPFAGISKIWISGLDCLLLYGLIICLFYFFYNRKVRLLQISMFLMLILAASFSLKKWSTLSTDNITFLSIRKHTGIVFKAGNKAIVLTDLADTDKTYRYSIQPYLDSCQVSEVKNYPPDSDIQSRMLIKKSDLIQFENKSIILLNRRTANLVLTKKIKVDCLHISGLQDLDTGAIFKYYDCKLLLTDAGNSKNTNEILEEQAGIKHVNYWNTGRNKSFTLVSN